MTERMKQLECPDQSANAKPPLPYIQISQLTQLEMYRKLIYACNVLY